MVLSKVAVSLKTFLKISWNLESKKTWEQTQILGGPFVYFHSSTQFFHICLHKFHGIVGNSLVQRNLWQTLQSLFTYRHSRVLLRYLDIIQN